MFFATRETANLIYSAIFPYNDANRAKFASEKMLEKNNFGMAFVEMEVKMRKQKGGKQKDLNQNIDADGSDTESDIEAEVPEVSNGKESGSSKPDAPASKPPVKSKKRANEVEPPTKGKIRIKALRVPSAPVLSEESSSDEMKSPVAPKAPKKKVEEAKEKASSSKSYPQKKAVAASPTSKMTSESAEEDSEMDNSLGKVANPITDKVSEAEDEVDDVSIPESDHQEEEVSPEKKPQESSTKQSSSGVTQRQPTNHVKSQTKKAQTSSAKVMAANSKQGKSNHQKKVVASSPKSEMTSESAEEDKEVDNSLRKVANAIKDHVSEAEDDSILESGHDEEEVSLEKKQPTNQVKLLTKKAQPSSTKEKATKSKQGKSKDPVKARRKAQEDLQQFLPMVRVALFQAKPLNPNEGLQAMVYLHEETFPNLTKFLLLKFPELIDTLEEICNMKNSRVFKNKSERIKMVADQMLLTLAVRFAFSL